jgi:hypothetical protein
MAACVVLTTSGCGTSGRSIRSSPSVVASTRQVAERRAEGAGTRLISVRPTTERGLLKRNYRIVAHLSVVEEPHRCESSLVVAGAYRCATGHGLFDPCWPLGSIASARNVYCLATPWERTVTEVSFREQLEPPERKSNEPLLIWGLRLANGQRCIARQGTGGSFHEIPIRFGCIGTNAEVLGEPNTSRALWRVRKVYFHVATRPRYHIYYTNGPVEDVHIAWHGSGD